MRRLRLSTFLISMNAGLLLLAVTGVAVVAVHLAGRFADEQAVARLAQASSNAQQAMNQFQGNALTATRILAERPTLQRLLRVRDTASLHDFLKQFQQTSDLDGCAVLMG